MVDARSFSSRPTGVGMYAYRLIKRMRAEGDARFVLLSDINESRELQELEGLGCDVRTYGRRIFKSSAVVRYFAWMKRQIADVRPDVFWEPNNLLPFRPKGVTRVIVTMHDTFGLGWSRQHGLWHLYYRFSFWRTLRNITEIWYNSNATRRQVEAHVFSHRTSSFFTLPSSCQVTHPIVEVPPLASVTPWEWPRPYFLYVGNVETRKGADILFEAYRQYREEVRTSFDLVVAGLERNVKVPDEPGVVKLGYVDDATKFSLMKSCAAFVVPSRDEGYGMQLAEAIKLGIRVIASDVPVFEEVEGSEGLAYLKGYCAASESQRVAMLKNALKDFVD